MSRLHRDAWRGQTAGRAARVTGHLEKLRFPQVEVERLLLFPFPAPPPTIKDTEIIWQQSEIIPPAAQQRTPLHESETFSIKSQT